MPYLCQDARALFLSMLALRLMAVIIATSYWCSRRCHQFVPLLVTLMYSSKTVHQRIVCVRQSSSFSVKLRSSLLQTYGLHIPNSPDLNSADYYRIMRCYAGLCLSDANSRLDRSEGALHWHVERTVAEYRWWCWRQMAEETWGLREGKMKTFWTFAVITDLELAWLCS